MRGEIERERRDDMQQKDLAVHKPGGTFRFTCLMSYTPRSLKCLCGFLFNQLEILDQQWRLIQYSLYQKELRYS